MPTLAGPVTASSAVHYRRREVVIVRCLTIGEAIASVVPACFAPVEPPLVTAYFADCDGVDMLAGRGYRLAAILVSAKFDSGHDHIEGAYPLVMFEDEPLAVITGRELLGVSKLYASISPFRVMSDGHVRCEVSVWGHPVLGIELSDFHEADASVLAAANQQSRLNLLGYKHIPALDGSTDTAYPIVTPMDVETKKLWIGQSGRIDYGNTREQDVGFIAPLITALQALPMIRFVSGVRTVDSVGLRCEVH